MQWNTINPLKKQTPHVLMINKAFQDTLLRKRSNYRTMYTVYFHFCKRDGVEKREKFAHKYIKPFWKVQKKLIMFIALKRDTRGNKCIFPHKVSIFKGLMGKNFKPALSWWERAETMCVVVRKEGEHRGWGHKNPPLLPFHLPHGEYLPLLTKRCCMQSFSITGRLL